MKSKLLNSDQPKTYALIFAEGDEVMAEPGKFAEDTGLMTSPFTAIGGFGAVTPGYLELPIKDDKRIAIRKPVEGLTITDGTARRPDGAGQVHAHVVVGKPDGTAHGGHLLSAPVFSAPELILTESPAYLHRQHDAATGQLLVHL